MFQSIITYIANHYAYSYVIISRFFQNLGAQTTCIMSIMEANEALRFYIVMLRAILLVILSFRRVKKHWKVLTMFGTRSFLLSGQPGRTARQAGRLAGRHAGRQADRQADRQKVSHVVACMHMEATFSDIPAGGKQDPGGQTSAQQFRWRPPLPMLLG